MKAKIKEGWLLKEAIDDWLKGWGLKLLAFIGIIVGMIIVVYFFSTVVCALAMGVEMLYQAVLSVGG